MSETSVQGTGFAQSPVWIIKLAIIGGLLIGLYYDVLYKMIIQWSDDPNYSHGFLVPLISLYLVWERREELKGVELRPSNQGLFVIIFGFALLTVANISAELFTMRFSFVVVIIGLVIFFLGYGFVKKVALPLGYLFFMIPLPYILYDSVAFPLKLFAARSSVYLLKLSDIPVFREGNLIYLSQTTLEVADACSGIRSLMSLIVIALAMAYFFQKGIKKKVLLVFLALPVAIAINILRIYVTGVLSHFYGEAAATGFLHEFEGFVMFAVAMVILIAICVLIARVGKKGGGDE